MAFLPVTAEEMKQRGWEQPDFVLVTGDAYVDHSSFDHQQSAGIAGLSCCNPVTA